MAQRELRYSFNVRDRYLIASLPGGEGTGCAVQCQIGAKSIGTGVGRLFEDCFEHAFRHGNMRKQSARIGNSSSQPALFLREFLNECSRMAVELEPALHSQLSEINI
jgi:hypothetical protein